MELILADPCLKREKTSGQNPRFFFFQSMRKEHYSHTSGDHPSKATYYNGPRFHVSVVLAVSSALSSMLCPPCSRVSCSQVPYSHVPCSQVPCSQVPCSQVPRRLQVRTIGSKRSTVVCFVALRHLPRLPPLSSPPSTDARTATRPRARDRHRRSRGRRTFAFHGTTVWPHADFCRSHGGRTRLPSRERCTRAPIPAWPRL